MIVKLIVYNLISLNLGFVLDLIIGDPNYRWHPIIIMGNLNKKLEKICYRKKQLKFKGGILVLISSLIIITIVTTIILLSYRIHPIFYIAVTTIFSYQIFATRSLYNAGMRVYNKLGKSNLQEAKKAVGMIVGRATEQLNEEEIINACVESIVENTSDGICAPMLALFLGGPIAGFGYKNINTLDSMIGYKNKRYYEFGYVAAKTDDLLNLIPARVSACLMIVSSIILKYDFKNAVNIYKRDRKNHLSPNAGHLESVAAGALNIQLGGTHIYNEEKVEKPTIGNKDKKSEPADIIKANRLMLVTSVLSLLIYNIFFIILLSIYKGV